MGLKAFLESLDDLPENLHEYYTEAPNNTGYVLDIDEKGFKAKIGEFRGNNTALLKKVDDLNEKLGKFKDVDPDKYKETLTELNELKEKQLLNDGKLDQEQLEKVVEQRTETIRRDYTSRISALEEAKAESDKEQEKYRRLYESNLVQNLAVSAFDGLAVIRKGALPDVMTRAQNTWRINEDGNIQAFNGDQPLYGSDGKPIGAKDWAKDLLTTAPHLFEGSTGGGAAGKTTDNASGGTNTKVISLGDKEAFSRNLEKVASGEIQVK